MPAMLKYPLVVEFLHPSCSVPFQSVWKIAAQEGVTRNELEEMTATMQRVFSSLERCTSGYSTSVRLQHSYDLDWTRSSEPWSYRGSIHGYTKSKLYVLIDHFITQILSVLGNKLHLCCGIQMVGSQFGFNDVKALIHPALYQHLSCWRWCHWLS